MTDTRHRPEPAAGVPVRSADRRVAGLLLVVAGSAVVLAIMTAEALYPAVYDLHRNTVSDLAAMRPDDVVRQPSAAIFNTTMVVAGALIAVAAVLLHRSRAGLVATVPVLGLGIGMIGVGVFPGNTVMAVHQLVSLATFLCGGVAAIATARLSARVLRPLHVVFGGVALTFLVGYTFLGDLAVFDRLGEGGVERWIVYPVVLWIVVLGAGLATARAGGPRTT
ncbi:DUF998 domain-containing protein [Blastococcus sp. MG754426]|uniref:DUF998 domain-containing protein n=1 Tax=unclassified Blastococcus TaxID=2619396 RepID=UPI001EF11EDD|nr:MULTISPECIES: DUF998 domain-containing protein [unclassified Blastococcus]MCF6509948.1 DUF998 domain-containing protein [Blastococcus sp. MG754426]MCF6514054.1 DUF998 domain-containing protein [Blastococcus sp. MG754427]